MKATISYTLLAISALALVFMPAGEQGYPLLSKALEVVIAVSAFVIIVINTDEKEEQNFLNKQ